VPATRPTAAACPPAWLVAVKDSGGLAEIDRLILHQAVTVVALELLRRRVADSTERRLAGDVLSASSRRPRGRRARAPPRAVRARRPRDRARARARASAPRRGCEAALDRGAARRGGQRLVAASGRFVCALLPGFLDDELFELSERVVDRARPRRSARRPGAGAGGRAGGRAREAYHEARCALEARELGAPAERRPAQRPRRWRGRDNGRDLPRPRLASSSCSPLQDSDALRLFCESLLGPIEHGEGHYGGELMRSLEAFIECNGQWEAAARGSTATATRCATGSARSRSSPAATSLARDRIEFWLALRGREIVRTPTTPTERHP
jgi:purine catabolism regulator